MKAWLIFACVLCVGLLQSADSLLLVVNTATEHETVGVLIDKEKRLFLTSHWRADSMLVGGKMDVKGPHGRYKANIIAEDPLYGLCVVQAESLKAVEGLDEVRLSSEMVTLGQALWLMHDKGFCLYRDDVQCGSRADVWWCAHPAQNVLLHASASSHKDGTILLNSAGDVCSLWQGLGWVPPAAVRSIVDRARKHVSAATQDNGKVWCFPWCEFGYEPIGLCQVFLGGYHHKGTHALMVLSTKKSGGFQPGDILLRVQGVDVEGDFEAVMDVLRTTKDSHVECVVLRYGEKITLQVPLELLEEKWLPYFSSRDAFVFSANQRFYYTFGVPEGALVCSWNVASHGAFLLEAINGKPMTYADFETLAAQTKPVDVPLSIVFRNHRLSNVSFCKKFPRALWVVRRVNPLG